jgi:primosomal replication protein N
MRALTAIPVILAVAASVAWLIIPAYTGETADVTELPSGAPHVQVSRTHSTLIEVNGPRVLVALAFPVLVALAPLLFPHRSLRIGAAVVLGAFAIVSGFSIGLFYLPSAAAMLAAALSRKRVMSVCDQ